MKKKLTQSELKEIIVYDPETGIMTWKEFGKNHHLRESACGGQHPSGYFNVTINRQPYKQHRLAWLYMKGKWPKGDIYHINRVKSDNRFCNLRDVTRRENLRNSKNFKSHPLIKSKPDNFPLTQTELVRAIFYNQKFGRIKLKRKNKNIILPENPEDVGKDGYMKIQIHGQEYNQHEVIVFYMTGRFPKKGEIIHINDFTEDNRFSNLAYENGAFFKINVRHLLK